MRIESIEANAVAVPLSAPTVSATRAVEERQYVIVRVVEYFALSEDIYNFERLVANPLTVADGQVVLDQTPGIGVEIDWEAVDWWAIPSSATGPRQHRANGKGFLGKVNAAANPPPVASLGEA